MCLCVLQVLIAGALSTAAMIPFTVVFPYLFALVNTYRSHTLIVADEIHKKYVKSTVEVAKRKRSVMQTIEAYSVARKSMAGQQRSPAVGKAGLESDGNNRIPVPKAVPRRVLLDSDGTPIPSTRPDRSVLSGCPTFSCR